MYCLVCMACTVWVCTLSLYPARPFSLPWTVLEEFGLYVLFGLHCKDCMGCTVSVYPAHPFSFPWAVLEEFDLRKVMLQAGGPSLKAPPGIRLIIGHPRLNYTVFLYLVCRLLPPW